MLVSLATSHLLQDEVCAGETSALLPTCSTYCVAVVVVGLSSGTVLSSDMEMELVVAGWLGVAGGGLALLLTFGEPLGGVSLGEWLAAGDADLLATCNSEHGTARNTRVRFTVKSSISPNHVKLFLLLDA